MICLSGNLPPLKVGRQKVVGYQTDWIERALARAAEAGGHQDCPFLECISEGVLHYLQHHCTFQLFPIEALYDRMRGMLRKIGCPDIADHLAPLAPPVTVSLVGPARLAGPKAKETLFEILNEEIRLLQQSGAELIRFCDLDAGVQILHDDPDDLESALNLKHEITVFLEERQHPVDSPHRALSLTLEP